MTEPTPSTTESAPSTPDETLMNAITVAIGLSPGLAKAVVLNPFSGVNEQKSLAYYPAELTAPVPLTFSKPGPASTYFGIGKKALEQTTSYSAVCDVITAATAALLTQAFKGKSLTVEVTGYVIPKAKSGHVFLVVNRLSTSDINDPATWGPGFAVDVWWAKQRITTGTNPVKTPTGGGYQDETYFSNLKGKKLTTVGSFTT
jgi:hypothetical protein